jgi:hypothetical protein
MWSLLLGSVVFSGGRLGAIVASKEESGVDCGSGALRDWPVLFCRRSEALRRIKRRLGNFAHCDVDIESSGPIWRFAVLAKLRHGL